LFVAHYECLVTLQRRRLAGVVGDGEALNAVTEHARYEWPQLMQIVASDRDDGELWR
jgi:hypothetical protein